MSIFGKDSEISISAPIVIFTPHNGFFDSWIGALHCEFFCSTKMLYVSFVFYYYFTNFPDFHVILEYNGRARLK